MPAVKKIKKSSKPIEEKKLSHTYISQRVSSLSLSS